MKLLSLLAVMVITVASNALASPTATELLGEARAAMKSGDLDKALEYSNQAVDADPKDSRCYSARAVLFELRREFEKAVADHTRVLELTPDSDNQFLARGEDLFRLGRFAESVADFDRLVKIKPEAEPYLWQRGIALYYAGEFDRAAKQFELHKTVNPDDVENAAWHFLCVARSGGVEKARGSLIAIKGDARVPMMTIHAMFAGTATPRDVIQAAEAGEPGPAELKQRLLYAHLYIGLFYEAEGKADTAKEHILIAAEKYAGDDYMGDVARVHAAVLKKATISRQRASRAPSPESRSP